MTERCGRSCPAFEVRAADAVILGGMGLLLVLAAVFHGRIAHPAAVIGRNLAYIGLYAGASAFALRAGSPGTAFRSFSLRVASAPVATGRTRPARAFRRTHSVM